MRYRITRRHPLTQIGLSLLAAVGLFAGCLAVSAVAGIPTALPLVFGLVGIAIYFKKSNTALLLDRAGVSVGDVLVPWVEISAIVVRRVPDDDAIIEIRRTVGPIVWTSVPPNRLVGDRLADHARAFAPLVQVSLTDDRTP